MPIYVQILTVEWQPSVTLRPQVFDINVSVHHD